MRGIGQTGNDGLAPALEVSGLTKSFGGRGTLPFKHRQAVQAVSNVSFKVGRGEILGIVGESGCGKSTTARLILRLLRPDAGDVRVGGELVSGDGKEALGRLRKSVQMVFQDSHASLNPRLTVGETVSFGPRIQGARSREADDVASEMLARVGLDPARFAGRFPHELSGGQRQRVNIARALSFQPKVLILDEPVSALDKSVEAQVINLLHDLREAFGLTYVFISHDLNVIRYLADRVLVMYLGKVIETGPAGEIFVRPSHPYTQALIRSVPSLDPDRLTGSPPLSGDPPSPFDPPSGCRFRTRCPFAEMVCAQREPELDARASTPDHAVACHLAEPGSGHSLAERKND